MMCSHDPDNKNNNYNLDFGRRLRFKVKLSENSEVNFFPSALSYIEEQQILYIIQNENAMYMLMATATTNTGVLGFKMKTYP